MAGIIPDDRFNDICMEYRRLDYNVGVLKLSLERAKKLDPNGDALEYVEDHLALVPTPTSEPTPTDPRLHLYQLRLRCYNQITLCFSGNDQLDLLLSAARSSKDRLFHYALYQWLFHQFKNGNGGEAELLSMGPDYIIDFFTNYVDFVDGFEFLAVYCRYWNKRYESALHYETLALEHPSKCPSIQAKYLGLALTQIKMAMDEAPAPKSIDLYHRLKQHLEDLRRGVALG
jgi:nuclear pore complex protein Nup155